LAELKFDEQDKTHELRKLALQAQIRMWEGQYHDGGRAITIEGSAVRGRIESSARRYLEVGEDEATGED
jgi:hypothetical protein